MTVVPEAPKHNAVHCRVAKCRTDKRFELFGLDFFGVVHTDLPIAHVKFRDLDREAKRSKLIETSLDESRNHRTQPKVALHTNAHHRHLAVEHPLDQTVIAVRFASGHDIVIVDVKECARVSLVSPNECAIENAPAALVECPGFVNRFVPNVVFCNLALVFLEVAVDTCLELFGHFFAATLVAVMLVETVALMAPHESVTAKLPVILGGEVGIFLHFFTLNLALLRFVFRPLELVFRNAMPEVLLGCIAVPIFGAILGVVERERRTERERVAQQLHVDLFARICLDREIRLAETIDASVSSFIPCRV